MFFDKMIDLNILVILFLMNYLKTVDVYAIYIYKSNKLTFIESINYEWILYLWCKLYPFPFIFYNYITLPNKIHSKECITFLYYSFYSVVIDEKE